MNELRQILNVSGRLRHQGREAVLATVVKVEGSTYRRPGARLLITEQSDFIGGVSGGCLEGDLVRKAWWRTEDGPLVVTYDSSADDETAWRLGLGCNGVVHVLLERLTPSGVDPLAFVRSCFDDGQRGILATAIRADVATGVAVGERLSLCDDGDWKSECDSDELNEQLRDAGTDCLARDRGAVEVFALPTGEVEVTLEVVRPPVRLLLFGAGFDAVPLAAAAAAVGWRVGIIDRRPGAANRPEFADIAEILTAPAAVACERLQPDARTAAVVMNHSFPDDRDAIAALLRTPVRYIGVLGPRARTEKILAELPTLGRGQRTRLFAPVGLDIGAEGPDEIAAAVVAQVIAVFAGRPGGHLHNRPGPIHRREPAQVVEVVS